MNILLAGDTHGDRNNISNLIDISVSKECSILFILGDFGFFPHLPEQAKFLDFCEQEFIRSGVEIRFIRGNHDNCKILNSLGEGIHKIRNGLFYHSDGFVWEWEGKKFVGIGGAYSIDKEFRTEDFDWWKCEQIPFYLTETEIGNVDFIFSHDAPISSNLDSVLDFRFDIQTIANRNKLQMICEKVCCSYLFHGHYHRRHFGYGSFSDGTEFTCVSLDANCGQIQNQIWLLEI